MQLAPQACALRLSSAGHRARPLGHVGERATQRLEAESALVLVSRSCRGGARALPRPSELLAAGAHLEGIWAVARAAPRSMEPRPIDGVRVAHRRRLHLLPAGGVAACEQLLFSRARNWRRRASEAGARASTQREAYRSTRVVDAGRTGPIRSASDAARGQRGLESGGSPRVPPARLITDAAVKEFWLSEGFELVVFLFSLI